MKKDQGACTDKYGNEIKKRIMHLIHRSNHDDDDENYDNNNGDEYYDDDDDDDNNNNNNNNNNSFVRSCVLSFIHSFKDLSTVL